MEKTIKKSFYFYTSRRTIVKGYGRLKLPSTKILMDSEQKKLLIFNEKPKIFPNGGNDFQLILKIKT